MASEEHPFKTTETKIKMKITLRDRLNNIKSNITLEPVILCYAIPRILIILATQNLNLDKACRANMNYGDTVCDALIVGQEKNYPKEEIAVQKLIAAMESWKNLICTAIPSLLILFMGAWSDRTRKRKIIIIVPIIGELLMCLSNILSVYYLKELPLQVTMFFEAFFPAITGGEMALYMGAYVYIGDATSEESRTFRLGIVNLCFWAADSIGSALSGILLKHIGYYGVFSLSSFLCIFSIVYGFYCLEDPKKPVKTEVTQKNLSKGRSFLKSFFDIKHVKETLIVAFKTGPDFRRTKMILILVSIFLMYGATSGENTFRYLFARYRFNWDALKYSFYKTFYISIHILGTSIGIIILSRYCKWDDSLLGLLASISEIMGLLITGFARNPRNMYIGAAVGMFKTIGFTALRSISSKLCSRDELGKMMSIFYLTEVMASTVLVPIYSLIYMNTMEYDAGIIYYISSVLTMPTVFIFGWFFKQYKITLNQEKKQEKDGEKDDKAEEELASNTSNINDYAALSTVDVDDENSIKNCNS